VASVQYGAVLQPLRVFLYSGPMSGWSDGELIERFLETDTDAAELAFAAIVDRHGPMVRRVCRQMLGDKINENTPPSRILRNPVLNESAPRVK
jgi:hypothetical protein